MFLLDTNVTSELRKITAGRADDNVRVWAERTSEHLMYLSTATLLELEMGVIQMERRDPKQGAMLRQWLEAQVLTSFAGRILSFDTAIARRGAMLHVPDRRPAYDAIIAATALVHGLTVVTRNTRDFEPMGVSLLNPWEAV